MNAADQVILAGKLRAALHAAGLRFESQRREGSKMGRIESEYVDLIGWATKGNYWLVEVSEDATPLAPARPPRLIQFPGERR